MIALQQIREAVDTSNTIAFIRAAFVSLGVNPANIKAVHHSPGGFSSNPRRWCVVLYHSVRLSAVTVNGCMGLSGAVWNGSVCWVIVGKVG